MASSSDIRAGRAYVELVTQDDTAKGQASARAKLEAFRSQVEIVNKRIAASGAKSRAVDVPDYITGKTAGDNSQLNRMAQHYAQQSGDAAAIYEQARQKLQAKTAARSSGFGAVEQQTRDEMAARIKTMRAETMRSNIKAEVNRRLFGGSVDPVAVASQVRQSFSGVEAPAKEAGDKAGKGFIAELNANLGKRSFAGKVLKILAGAGAVGAAGMAAKEFNELTKKAEEYAVAASKGGAAEREAREELLKSIPIVGALGEGLRRAFDLFGGYAVDIARIEQATKNQQIVTEAWAANAKTVLEYHKETLALVQRIRQEQELDGKTGSARTVEEVSQKSGKTNSEISDAAAARVAGIRAQSEEKRKTLRDQLNSMSAPDTSAITGFRVWDKNKKVSTPFTADESVENVGKLTNKYTELEAKSFSSAGAHDREFIKSAKAFAVYVATKRQLQRQIDEIDKNAAKSQNSTEADKAQALAANGKLTQTQTIRAAKDAAKQRMKEESDSAAAAAQAKIKATMDGYAQQRAATVVEHDKEVADAEARRRDLVEQVAGQAKERADMDARHKEEASLPGTDSQLADRKARHAEERELLDKAQEEQRKDLESAKTQQNSIAAKNASELEAMDKAHALTMEQQQREAVDARLRASETGRKLEADLMASRHAAELAAAKRQGDNLKALAERQAAERGEQRKKWTDEDIDAQDELAKARAALIPNQKKRSHAELEIERQAALRKANAEGRDLKSVNELYDLKGRAIDAIHTSPSSKGTFNSAEATRFGTSQQQSQQHRWIKEIRDFSQRTAIAAEKNKKQVFKP